MARNRQGHEQGQAVEAAIFEILRNHSPLDMPLLSKQINERLIPELRRADRTIRWHMEKIRKRCHRGNLFAGVDGTS
jgi:hypothetical protein